MRERRRDRKRGQVFARCWSQDILGTREDTEKVTEETQGQFPVLPTKSESKWNDFFPCKSFFHLHQMCLCLRIHYVMYWCLQFIVCKINKHIRVLRSLLKNTREFNKRKHLERKYRSVIQWPFPFGRHHRTLTIHMYKVKSLYFCVSHIYIKDSLSWPHILPQWIFWLDLMGQTSAQSQYAFSIILKQKE